MTRLALPRVRTVVNCSIYNQPFVNKQCHGCCIESMCKTLLQSVETFLNLYLSCCNCYFISFKSPFYVRVVLSNTFFNLKTSFLPCNVVRPSHSQVQPGFLVLPFRRYISVIKPLLNVKFSKIYRFNSDLR